MSAFRHAGFGLLWSSPLELAQFAAGTDGQHADVEIRVMHAALPPRVTHARCARVEICGDGFRCHADDVAVFDFFMPGQLDIYPARAWSNSMPSFFYGVVSAAIVALRGAIPLHGSAVEVNGRAILLCGASGRGKSSIASCLATLGGRLISDDLSVLVTDASGKAGLYPGRNNIRLSDVVLPMLAAIQTQTRHSGVNALGKHLIEMPAVPPLATVALRSVILLGTEEAPARSPQTALLERQMLVSHLFRPRLMQRLPGQSHRMQTLLRLGSDIRFCYQPSPMTIDASWVKNTAQAIHGLHSHASR